MSDGKITFSSAAQGWCIEAKPHVSLKLKRIFAQLGKAQQGSLLIKNTPEVCRELAWVRLRYELDVIGCGPGGFMADVYLERQAEFHRSRTEVVQKLLAGSAPPRAFELAIPAREYQKVAADVWIHVGGLLLADDLGVGKTASCICALTDPRLRPALIVTMTHLPRQWEAEIKKFAPDMRVHVVKRGTPSDGLKDLMPRKERGTFGKQDSLPGLGAGLPDAIIINYNKLSGWAETLRGHVNSVAFDEIQELRTGPGTAKYAAAMHVAEACSWKIGLSASPIYNLGDEFHSVISILRNDSIGTRGEFMNEWGGGSEGKIKDPVAFGQWLRDEGVMLRRTRADVGRELPALTIVSHTVEADLSEIEKVASDATALARIILQGGGKGFDKLKASEELSWKLRQATGIAKAPYVAEFVRVLTEAEGKVVLFGWHHASYAIYAEKLKDLGVEMYTGDHSPKQKDDAKKRFVEGDAKVLVMSLRSGAGLDGLQHVCRTVVFGELDWSPKVMDQCVGRVHRDGQKEKVFAYYLMVDAGSDPVVSDVLGVKQQQSEGVLNPDVDAASAPLIGSDRDVKKLAEDFLRRRGLAVQELKEVS